MEEVSTENAKTLFKDLCARAPYYPMVSVMVHCEDDPDPHTRFKQVWEDEELTPYILHDIYQQGGNWEYIKPYLRSQSSMTEEEAEEMFHLMYPNDKLLKVELEQDFVRFIRLVGGKSYQGTLCIFFNKIYSLKQLDWYYSKHFDVRGLIPLNLAIEAPEGMYK